MNAPPSPKKRLYEQLARVAKALAQPGRLELLEALGQGERSVEGLATASGMSVANTSHHLQTLRDGGLVRSRRDGLQVIYGLSDPDIPKLMSCMRNVAERHLAEVERIVRENFDSRDGLTPVKRDELLKLVKKGAAMVIDVRPPEEFAAGHIPGAVNIPIDVLPKRLKILPKEQEIARRLEEGFPEWKAERLPVVEGD
jgi:DNA-binding transcriptional ArsR family regulator